MLLYVSWSLCFHCTVLTCWPLSCLQDWLVLSGAQTDPSTFQPLTGDDFSHSDVCLSLNTEQSCRVPCSSPKPLISFCWACSMQPSSWGQWCCCHQAGSVNLGVRAYLEISVYDLNVRKWNGNLTLYLSHANQSISSNEQFKVVFFFF